MIRFLLGNLLVFGGALGWNGFADAALHYGPKAALIRLAIVLVLIPMTMTAGASMLVHRARPRRLFDGHRLIAPVLLGIFTAVLSTVLTTLAVVFIDRLSAAPDIFDAAATGGSSLIATSAVLLLLCRR